MNAENKRELQRRYYAENRDRIREQQRRYRETHKEKIKELNRCYSISHAAERRTRAKQWRLKHQERRADYIRCWSAKNREKIREYGRKWRESNPEVYKQTARRAGLKHRYGITEAAYETMYSAQSGKCLICGQSEDILCVDHNHATGAIRGLLCRVCNLGIGKFQDDPSLCERAAKYLRQTGSPA
jgi:hypothetical protein